MLLIIKDNTSKQIDTNHIVAVRYVWNSYVGIATARGLTPGNGISRSTVNTLHPWSDTATYQIIGHLDPKHPDFNKEVFDWYNTPEGNCPVKLTIYDN